MAPARISTWLITGASSGLGKSLAQEALEAGHKVIGTTRDILKAYESCPDFTTKGGTWLQLDPSQKDAYEQFAKCSQEHSIDVLVNNAGYAFIGSVEDTRQVMERSLGICSVKAKRTVKLTIVLFRSEDEVRSQMEVNFYGPLCSVRALLPSMRAKGSGNIVLISSGAG